MGASFLDASVLHVSAASICERTIEYILRAMSALTESDPHVL